MAIEFVEYGPDVQNNLRFGYGDDALVTLRAANEKLTLDEIVLLRAFSGGCSTRDKQISIYGPEWMENRYAETNEWHDRIVNVAYNNRYPAVYDLLTTPQIRLDGEEVGEHEPLAVPKSHLWKIAPMAGL